MKSSIDTNSSRRRPAPEVRCSPPRSNVSVLTGTSSSLAAAIAVSRSPGGPPARPRPAIIVSVSSWFRSYGFADVFDGLLIGAYPLDEVDVSMLASLGVQRARNLAEESEYRP